MRRGGRPISQAMEARHTPVMVAEAVAALQVRADGWYIDCTVGEGGHAEAVLSAVEPAPRVLGIDVDAEALAVARRRLEPFGDAVALVQGTYAELAVIARAHGFDGASGVLMDLGVSALQLEMQERGFSFSRPGRLDMRFDRSQALTAEQLVNRAAERELADIIFRYGEERRARRIARAIVRSRPLEWTTGLAAVVARAAGPRKSGGVHPATKTFQALRIAVNDELANVAQGTQQAIHVLAPGGRFVAISYHSLEDRLVKSTLRRESSGCICPQGAPDCRCGHSPTVRLVSRRIVRPSPAEVRANPRSRSAGLRTAERL